LEILNFLELEESLLNDCKRIINDFANSDENKDVYAFVIYSNPTYGELLVYWNTLDSFQKYIDKHYPHWTYKQIYGDGGLLFSVGDFSYQAFDFSERTEEFIEKYVPIIESDLEENEWWNYYNGFVKAQINVIDKLKNEFQLLNKTGDFIAYVIDADKWDHELMSMTVPENSFKKLFPNLDYPPRIDN
jgi:hypothetical protein